MDEKHLTINHYGPTADGGGANSSINHFSLISATSWHGERVVIYICLTVIVVSYILGT